MGAAASIFAWAAATADDFPRRASHWRDAGIFSAGVLVGLAMAASDSIYNAAEAVMDYVRVVSSSAYQKAKKADEVVFVSALKDGVVKPVCDKASSATTTEGLRSVASSAMEGLRSVASSAMEGLRWVYEKLKAAAAAVTDTVMKLVRYLRGRNEADAAKSEVERAASGEDAVHDVLSRASARAAGFRQLQDVRSLPPPCSFVVSAAAPGGALALTRSVAAPAARAARRASEMMALVQTVEVAELIESLSEEARFCISVVLAAAGIGLDAIAAAKDA